MKRVEVVKDNTKKVFQSLADLLGQQVLIGIPESTAERGDEPINNATIGYLMEFGSPAANIPPRPFLIPGVEKAEKPALAEFRKAADAALEGETKQAAQHMTAAGIIGANQVLSEINSNLPPPLKPGTIANRHRQRGTKKRAEEVAYAELLKLGMTPEQAQGDAGIVSLIDTGKLRNSITSVVRKK